MTGITYMPGAALSPREAEVLTLMAEEGCTAKEVAHRLKVSHRTVEIQVANAVNKLGARNRMQAIVWFDRRRRAAGVNPSDGSWPPQAMKDRLNAARERAAADYHEGRERLANAPLTGEDDAPPTA